jgi:flagellar biosynthetic protein FliR
MPAETALAAEAWPIFLVFARVGAAVMLVPGFGEHQVLPRLRLLLALAVSLLLAPALAQDWPPLPPAPLTLALPILREVLVGLLIGVAARMCLAALHVGGSLIAMQAGLSAAAMLDPNEGVQSMLPASFLTSAALALMFAAGLHHLLLRAFAASYAVLPVGGSLAFGDGGELLTRLGAEALATGLRIAAPMVVAGLAVNLGLGALARMVPAFPVLSLALPAQLLLALLMIELSLPEALALFSRSFQDGIAWLAPGAG